MDNIWKKIAERAMQAGMENKDPEIGLIPEGRTPITGNAMNIIQPRKEMGTWVFDDKARGLSSEPFVMGIPEMIDDMVMNLGLNGKEIRFLFSKNGFPGYQLVLKKVSEEYGGGNYEVHESNTGELTNKKGWLCPATLLYFETLPDFIYIRIEEI